jgi:pSer/pThr/pTyr-binding forkhead associated (FHA) protein
MTEAQPLRFHLTVDGDRVALAERLRIGCSLDNDIVTAGDEVDDYHLRIELVDRGPVAVPVGANSFVVNGRHRSMPTGLMPGDRIEVGEVRLTLEADGGPPVRVDEWRLHAPGDGAGTPLHGVVDVGREPDSALCLPDGHVSRRHARLVNCAGTVWVQDLASANGTFVNGRRISGACRLFHGDEVRFDIFPFQLLGRGVDLTPPAPWPPGPARPIPTPPHVPGTAETIEFAAVHDPPAVPAVFTRPIRAGTYVAGMADLLGINPARLSVVAHPGDTGVLVRLPMGRTLLGRGSDCDLTLRDLTVSAHHAELVARPEGTMLTDLMSRNGTWLNGHRVQSARLSDGDLVTLGRTHLLFRERGALPARSAGRRLLWLLAALLVAAAAVLAWLL